MNDFGFLRDYLDKDIFEALKTLEDVSDEITEIRLRRNRNVVIVQKGTSRFLYAKDKAVVVDDRQFDEMFLKMCDYSLYSNEESLKNGYITLKNGARIGICSTAVYNSDLLVSTKNITSLNVRLPREIKGFGEKAVNNIFTNGLKSVLIAGKPSSGKTTLLRDIARLLSDKMYKVCVIDSRNELAGKQGFDFTLDLGVDTDVLTGFEKSQAVDIALRTMSPQLIVCDEISKKSELRAICNGFSSGVYFLASVHADDISSIFRRTVSRELILSREFQKIIMLSDNFEYKIFDTDEVIYENSGLCDDNNMLKCVGNYKRKYNFEAV